MLGKDHRLQGVALCAWSLQQAIHKMDHCDIILTKEEAEEIRGLLAQYLLHWQGLSNECKVLSVKRWKNRPKHHYLEEIGLHCVQTQINPRFTACWQDESFLGHIKKIAVSCHSNTVLLRVMQRLILNLSLRWKDTREHAREVLS